MKISARITAPILCAILCAGALVAFLWWQLTQSTEILRRATNEPTNEPTIIQPVDTISAAVDPRDQALFHLRQGDLLALRGQWADAQEEYEKAVDANGGLPALRKLAQTQMQRRDISGVRSTLRQLKKAGAKTEDLLLLESIVALRSGELLEARKILQNAEDSPQKHYGLALLSIIEGNHEQSQLELQEVINGWEPVLRSNARTIMASYMEFSLFEESLNIHLITLLARALAQVQECELALPLLVQVTQAKDDYRDAWIVQGYCELTTERPEQALASLEQAYNLDPQKPEIQYFLARSYAAINNHKNAIIFYEYALQNGFQQISEVRRQIAKSALLSGDADLALQQYETLTKEPNATIEPYEGYVTASIALGHSEEAYFMAKEAVKQWPKDAISHDLLGWAALESDRKEEARRELEKALDINPYLLSAKERMKQL